MSKLIITADKHYLGELCSFLIFDLETNRVIDKAPYTELLNANMPTKAGREPFRPFGIAQSEDHVFIASNSNIVKFNNKTLEPIDLVSNTGVVNTHQIVYYEGYLYRANTSNDTITRIDLDTLEEIHFDFKTMSMIDKIDKPASYNESDSYHINSLLIDKGLLYVMAHNLGKRESELFTLTLDFKEVHHVANLGTAHHEIIIHNEFLYSLDTGSGNLIKLDLNTWQQYKWLLIKNMFLRGMELIGDTLEIFASQLLTTNTDESAIRITFNINDYSITNRIVDDLAVVTCVQKYRGV